MFANLEEDYSDKESDESDTSDKDTDDKDAPPKHLEAQVKIFTKCQMSKHAYIFFSLIMFHCRPTTQLGACM